MANSQSVMSRLRAMRVGAPSAVVEEERPEHEFDLAQIRSLVQTDPSLDKKQRDKVTTSLDDPAFVQRLKSGVVGGALAFLLAKYMKLKPTTQLLLSLAGFGVGKIIYDYRHDQNRSSRYNEKLRMYEIAD